MSAMNLRSVKREFSKLNYRPDVCHPSLMDQLENILKITGKQQIKRSYVVATSLFEFLSMSTTNYLTAG